LQRLPAFEEQQIILVTGSRRSERGFQQFARLERHPEPANDTRQADSGARGQSAREQVSIIEQIMLLQLATKISKKEAVKAAVVLAAKAYPKITDRMQVATKLFTWEFVDIIRKV
jgi:hypothetical protein